MRNDMRRRHPAKGVFIFRGQPTIVFLTVFTQNRTPCLANTCVHDALVASWDDADAWLVGCYLIMPDHIHLFCSPTNEECEIEHWISFWKRQFRRRCGENAPRFQSRGFHHRLRPGQLDGVSPYHIAIWFSESLANHNSVSHRVDRRWRSLALPEFPLSVTRERYTSSPRSRLS